MLKTSAAAIAVACLLFAGCRQDMGQQPKYHPLQPSTLFADGRSARQPVANTVTRNIKGDDPLPADFKSGDQYVTAIPRPLSIELLERGRQRFNIYCAPCHGESGRGDGMIVRRGFDPPPSLHNADVRSQPAGFYYDVITNGFGAMAGYSSQVTVDDRWAVIAYIRALQLSQNASLADVPPEQRAQLK